MKTKAPRLVVALIALVGVAGMAVPADAAPAPKQGARSVWCC